MKNLIYAAPAVKGSSITDDCTHYHGDFGVWAVHDLFKRYSNLIVFLLLNSLFM